MHRIKQIASAASVFLILACCAATLLLNTSVSGWRMLAVPTGSMRPTITPGSLVLVHSVPARDLRVGDIITYINPLMPTSTLTHRIIRTYVLDHSVQAFVTKGDANTVADVPITEGSVQGKVVAHIPAVGTVLLLAKNPFVVLPIIYFAATLLIIEEVQRLNAYFKTRQPYVLRGFGRRNAPADMSLFIPVGATLAIALVVGTSLYWQPAFALLGSNKVALVHNHLRVAKVKKPKCDHGQGDDKDHGDKNDHDQDIVHGVSSKGSRNTLVNAKDQDQDCDENDE